MFFHLFTVKTGCLKQIESAVLLCQENIELEILYHLSFFLKTQNCSYSSPKLIRSFSTHSMVCGVIRFIPSNFENIILNVSISVWVNEAETSNRGNIKYFDESSEKIWNTHHPCLQNCTLLVNIAQFVWEMIPTSPSSEHYFYCSNDIFIVSVARSSSSPGQDCVRLDPSFIPRASWLFNLVSLVVFVGFPVWFFTSPKFRNSLFDGLWYFHN